MFLEKNVLHILKMSCNRSLILEGPGVPAVEGELVKRGGQGVKKLKLKNHLKFKRNLKIFL